MCNKNGRAPLLANQRNQVEVSCAQLTRTHTKTAQTHKRPTHSYSNRRLFLGRSLCREQEQRSRLKNSATLCKWVELREECAALCQYSYLFPCRIPRVSPFDIRRPIRNGVTQRSRAPYKIKLGRLYKSAMNVGCAHTRTHSPPSNRRLFLGRSLCRGTRNNRGRAQKNDRATLSKWVELGMFCQVNTPTRIAL